MTALPISLDRHQARLAASGLAGLRGLIGVAALVAPGMVLRPWAGGAVSSETGGKLLGRALGGRDLALAAGAFLAMRHEAPVRGWIEAGGLADTGDLVATVVAFRALPRGTRVGVLLLTLAAVATAYVVAPVVDGDGNGQAS